MLRGSVAHTTLHRFYAGLPQAARQRARSTESRLDEALAFLRRVPGRRARDGVQHRDDRARAARARAEPPARPRAARRATRRARRRRSCRASSRSGSAPSARRPSSSAGSTSATASRCPGRSTGSTSIPFSARGIVQDYKSGRTGHSAARDREGAAAPDPALHARAARPRRDRAARRPLPAARRRAPPPAACSAPRRRTTCCPASSRTTTSTRTRSGRRSRARASSRASLAQRIRARRRRVTTRRDGRLPGLVRPLARCAGSSERDDERAAAAERRSSAAAIAARGQVFVSAGAGTGKTTVLVERFVAAVCERGPRRRVDARDHLHASAPRGSSAARIRARAARASAAHDLARSLDGAWISTIHGFCLRLLKAHPFAAGLDPRFRVLDDSQAPRDPRRGVRARRSNEFCAGRRRRRGSACWRRTARRGCARCSPACTSRCAPRDVPPLELAERAPAPGRRGARDLR